MDCGLGDLPESIRPPAVAIAGDVAGARPRGEHGPDIDRGGQTRDAGGTAGRDPHLLRRPADPPPSLPQPHRWGAEVRQGEKTTRVGFRAVNEGHRRD